MKVSLTNNEKNLLIKAVLIRKSKYVGENLTSGKHVDSLEKIRTALLNEPFEINGFAMHLFKGLINGEIEEMANTNKPLNLSEKEYRRLFVLAGRKFDRKKWNQLERLN
ncbi:MAG: hypothetical protein Aureis2KO_17380 [Aureisphaera sp.]